MAEKKPAESIKDKQAKGAQRAMLEELFNDLYLARGKVYRLNFVRGITFGLGSAIGGTIGFTIVIALLVWLLGMFDGFPVIGDYLQSFSEDISQQ